MNAPNPSFAAVESDAVENPLAKELTEEYFRSFNENQFEQTAALFAKEGALVPPFESPVVGEQAILAYLKKEASNITAFPKGWDMSKAEDNCTRVVVTGKVNAIVFKVNVAWYFAIATFNQPAQAKIKRVRIKLLASPAELLGLKPADS